MDNDVEIFNAYLFENGIIQAVFSVRFSLVSLNERKIFMILSFFFSRCFWYTNFELYSVHSKICNEAPTYLDRSTKQCTSLFSTIIFTFVVILFFSKCLLYPHFSPPIDPCGLFCYVVIAYYTTCHNFPLCKSSLLLLFFYFQWGVENNEISTICVRDLRGAHCE